MNKDDEGKFRMLELCGFFMHERAAHICPLGMACFLGVVVKVDGIAFEGRLGEFFAFFIFTIFTIGFGRFWRGLVGMGHERGCGEGGQKGGSEEAVHGCECRGLCCLGLFIRWTGNGERGFGIGRDGFDAPEMLDGIDDFYFAKMTEHRANDFGVARRYDDFMARS